MNREEYLRAVGWELRDLPWATRRDLLDDLRGHLDEVPPEQLAPPKAYVAELREAEGLERRHGVVAFLRARSPRNLAIVAALLVLVALLASAFAWVQSYQPLRQGNYGVTVPQPRTGAAGEESVTFRDGEPFELGFSVENNGPFTVRVSGGPHPSGNDPYTARLLVSGPLVHVRSIPGPLTRFRPFDLPPGEQRMLVLKGVFSHCPDWGGLSSFAIDSFPVAFDFLWHTEIVRIPLGSEFVIRFPAGHHCLSSR